MEKATFEKKLEDLIEELERFPMPSGPGFVDLICRNRAYQEKLAKSSESLQDSLDFLRLSVKYLLFDLDATRRENATLMRLLEDHP